MQCRTLDAGSRLLSVMSPILERFVALAICVLLCRLLLGQVPLVVGNHLAHVGYIILVILLGVSVGIPPQYLDDFASARMSG